MNHAKSSIFVVLGKLTGASDDEDARHQLRSKAQTHFSCDKCNNIGRNMFKTLGIRCRRHTCKVILLTSLVWCVLDILILLTYSDCSNGMGWGCKNGADSLSNNGHHQIPGKRGALQYAHQVSQEFEPPKSQWDGYMKAALRTWKPAPVVLPNKGMPGEMGKAVLIPKEREDEKKEKFKINQFNLLASEMISLNRSLADVRLSA